MASSTSSACGTQSDEAQAAAIQHERSSLRCRRAVLLELDSCSVVSGDLQATGRGFESRRRQAQAGGVPRIARGLEGKKINLVIVLLAEGKKINLAVGAQWHSKKKKRRAGSELGRGFEVKSSIGR